MTYNVFGGTLSLTQSINQPVAKAHKVFFTALHKMQTRSSERILPVLSVRLSVKRVDCDKTDERSVHIFTPYER